MERETSTQRHAKRASTDKALRIVGIAVLLQMSWPKRLTRDEIIRALSRYYGENPFPALYRDLATLTKYPVEELPEPNDEA